MEEQLETLKNQLVEEEKNLAMLVDERNKLRENQIKNGNDPDSALKRQLRNMDHDILVKEGDICIIKKKIKQLTYKLEIASKMTAMELEEDINDLKVLLGEVGQRLQKNKELAVETFDHMMKMQERGSELVKEIEASKQKAMGECDVRSDKLMARLDARQQYVDEKKREIKEIRRASGIPDPEELAEIRRLAALNDQSGSKSEDD